VQARNRQWPHWLDLGGRPGGAGPVKRRSGCASEWELFWQEVEMEAERLETDSDGPRQARRPTPANRGSQWEPERKQPERIDDLRAAVAALTRRLEDPRPDGQPGPPLAGGVCAPCGIWSAVCSSPLASGPRWQRLEAYRAASMSSGEPLRQQRRARLAHEELIQLGSAFIKLGPLLSGRPTCCHSAYVPSSPACRTSILAGLPLQRR